MSNYDSYCFVHSKYMNQHCHARFCQRFLMFLRTQVWKVGHYTQICSAHQTRAGEMAVRLGGQDVQLATPRSDRPSHSDQYALPTSAPRTLPRPLPRRGGGGRRHVLWSNQRTRGGGWIQFHRRRCNEEEEEPDQLFCCCPRPSKQRIFHQHSSIRYLPRNLSYPIQASLSVTN